MLLAFHAAANIEKALKVARVFVVRAEDFHASFVGRPHSNNSVVTTPNSVIATTWPCTFDVLSNSISLRSGVWRDVRGTAAAAKPLSGFACFFAALDASSQAALIVELIHFL